MADLTPARQPGHGFWVLLVAGVGLIPLLSVSGTTRLPAQHSEGATLSQARLPDRPHVHALTWAGPRLQRPQWQVLCAPSLAWLSTETGRLPWVVLAAGLLLTAVLSAYLWLRTNTGARSRKANGVLHEARRQLEQNNAELKRAQARLDHLNAVHRAIYAVHRLITRQDDRGALLSGVCRTLTESGGYRTAWLARFDDTGRFAELCHCGLGVYAGPLEQALRSGQLPVGVEQALSQSEPVLSAEPMQPQGAGPQNVVSGEPATTMTRRLEHSGKIYGLLSVSSAANTAGDSAEQALFGELADDIAYALHRLDVEGERQWALAALRVASRRMHHTLAEFRAVQQAVIQHERMRALGQMARGIAHDFNNALTPIIAFTDLLLADSAEWQDTAKVRRYLESTNTAARDAAGVVKRLQGFYREYEEDEAAEEVCLNELVDAAVSLTGAVCVDRATASGSHVSVVKDFGELPRTVGCADELREAFRNLILNAAEAMPRHGIITVSTRADRDTLVVEVSDTGVGMSERVRSRCLEPFFTTTGEGGRGMGLALVYGTVARHRGTVEVESQEGRGTTVRIGLPIIGEQRAYEQTAPLDRSALPLRVLLVARNEVVREVLRCFLESEGHDVSLAATGEQAAEQMASRPCDLVIADCTVATMNGAPLARMVKGRRPHVPVILLAETDNMPDVAESQPEHVDLVLGKPVDLEALQKSIARAASR